MNPIDARFTLSQVSDATGVSVNTIRTWYQRGHFTIGATDRALGNGVARLVSGHTALAIGIAGVLVDMGVPPARAALAGFNFAHTGADERPIGGLWPHPARTILALADESWSRPGRIVRIDPETRFVDIFHHGLHGSNPRGALILEMDELVDGLTRRLEAQIPSEG